MMKSPDLAKIVGTLGIMAALGMLWSCHRPSLRDVSVQHTAPTMTLPAPAAETFTPIPKPAVTATARKPAKRHRAHPPILKPAPRPALVKCAGFHPFRELWVLVRHYVARKPLAC